MLDKAKPFTFTWSYSKLKNYETCPRRYYEIGCRQELSNSHEVKR